MVGPTSELTGRGEQHPTSKANYQLKNELAALRSNELFGHEPKPAASTVFVLRAQNRVPMRHRDQLADRKSFLRRPSDPMKHLRGHHRSLFVECEVLRYPCCRSVDRGRVDDGELAMHGVPQHMIDREA